MLRERKSNNVIKPIVISVWGPGGRNTASLSVEIAKKLSEKNKTLLAEMPCLGLPRIHFEIKKRATYIDQVLSDFDRTGMVAMEFPKDEKLVIFPINNIVLPDAPVSLRANLESLIMFPEALVNKARLNGIDHIVLDCQGQITTPLTFISLRICNKVFMYINDTYEVNWGMAVIKQLLDDYEMPGDKIAILTENTEEIHDVLLGKYSIPIMRPAAEVIMHYLSSSLSTEPEKRENDPNHASRVRIKI